jgi:Na+-driven multidrug efflux pump
MPMGYLLPFKFNMGLLGLMIGYISGMFLAAVIFTYMLLKYDWK